MKEEKLVIIYEVPWEAILLLAAFVIIFLFEGLLFMASFIYMQVAERKANCYQ